MYQFKILLYSTITILLNLLFVSKSYALGINDLKIKKLHDFEYAWGMDLIDNENLLVSEKRGLLYIYNFSNGKIVGKEKKLTMMFSLKDKGDYLILFM